MKAARLTISDRASAGFMRTKRSGSGARLRRELAGTVRNDRQNECPTNAETIARTIALLADDEQCDLISPPGTGPARRDVTRRRRVTSSRERIARFWETQRALSFRPACRPPFSRRPLPASRSVIDHQFAGNPKAIANASPDRSGHSRSAANICGIGRSLVRKTHTRAKK